MATISWSFHGLWSFSLCFCGLPFGKTPSISGSYLTHLSWGPKKLIVLQKHHVFGHDHYIYIHSIYTYTYINYLWIMYIYIRCAYVCVYIYISYIHIVWHWHKYMWTYVHTHSYVWYVLLHRTSRSWVQNPAVCYLCIYIYIYTHMYVYIYLYI